MAAATEEKVLATNRAAFHDYHISTKYEAGAALIGTEVKSVLGGRIQLKESYVGVREGEAWLFNAHISPYSHGNRENHDPLRTRKLLLHKREIEKLDQAAAAQGMTLVVTRVYLKGRRDQVRNRCCEGQETLRQAGNRVASHRRSRDARAVETTKSIREAFKINGRKRKFTAD